MFTNELLLQEDTFFILDTNKIIIFEEKKGVISSDEKTVGFEWKVNKKGILILKLKNEIQWFKLDKSDNSNLKVSHYKKIDNEFLKVNSYNIKKDSYKKEKKDIQDKFVDKIKKEIYEYSKLNYIVFFLLSSLIISSFMLIMNSLILVKDISFALKFFFSFIILFHIKEYVVIFGLLISKKIKLKKKIE